MKPLKKGGVGKNLPEFNISKSKLEKGLILLIFFIQIKLYLQKVKHVEL